MINNIIYSSNISESVDGLLQAKEYDKLFILTDENTLKVAMPLLSDSKKCNEAHVITILADDTNKNLENLSTIWRALVDEGATRKSLLINLGGGMVTDMGGFAAATFKRGIEHINIPTTLLGAVDAAVGGKTGINFEGLKNEIGAFKQPSAVLIDTRFFKTLSKEHLLSGFAEMLKHGLISNVESYNKLIAFDISNPDYDQLLHLVADSVSIKENIVEEDPLEKGIRKYLNLGHTTGHAIETQHSRSTWLCRSMGIGVRGNTFVYEVWLLSTRNTSFGRLCKGKLRSISNQLRRLCLSIRKNHP